MPKWIWCGGSTEKQNILIIHQLSKMMPREKRWTQQFQFESQITLTSHMSIQFPYNQSIRRIWLIIVFGFWGYWAGPGLQFFLVEGWVTCSRRRLVQSCGFGPFPFSEKWHPETWFLSADEGSRVKNLYPEKCPCWFDEESHSTFQFLMSSSNVEPFLEIFRGGVPPIPHLDTRNAEASGYYVCPKSQTNFEPHVPMSVYPMLTSQILAPFIA